MPESLMAQAEAPKEQGIKLVIKRKTKDIPSPKNP